MDKFTRSPESYDDRVVIATMEPPSFVVKTDGSKTMDMERTRICGIQPGGTRLRKKCTPEVLKFIREGPPELKTFGKRIQGSLDRLSESWRFVWYLKGDVVIRVDMVRDIEPSSMLRKKAPDGIEVVLCHNHMQSMIVRDYPSNYGDSTLAVEDILEFLGGIAGETEFEIEKAYACPLFGQIRMSGHTPATRCIVFSK